MRGWLLSFVGADMSQSDPTQHEIDVYAGEFVLIGDKTKAWRKAYPVSKAKPEAASVAAQKMHNFTKVLLRIVELQAKTAEEDAAEFDMSVTGLKETLNRVMVAGLEQDGSGKYQGLGAVNGAVGEFNRMCGNHAPAKAELTGKNGGAIETADMSERELGRRIAFALAKAAKKDD